MEPFIARLDLRSALELFLFLDENESSLSGGPAAIYAQLRSYLYERLSIEEMENPQALLGKL